MEQWVDGNVTKFIDTPTLTDTHPPSSSYPLLYLKTITRHCDFQSLGYVRTEQKTCLTYNIQVRENKSVYVSLWWLAHSTCGLLVGWFWGPVPRSLEFGRFAVGPHSLATWLWEVDEAPHFAKHLLVGLQPWLWGRRGGESCVWKPTLLCGGVQQCFRGPES